MVLKRLNTVPTSFFDANAARRQRAERIVYSEADFHQAITTAYKNPSQVSSIRLGADIFLSDTLYFKDAPAGFNGFLIDGSGQFTISNRNALSVMFDIGTSLTMRDVRVNATSVSGAIFQVEAGSKVSLSGLDLTTSSDGYVFDFTGDQRNTFVENISITDDGSLIALISGGRTASKYWTLKDLRLFGVLNILDAASGTSYLNVSLDGISVDPTATPLGARLTGELFGSVIENTQNISYLSVGSGFQNQLKHNQTTAIPGSMFPGSTDIVIGAAGYTVDASGVSAYIAHNPNDGYGQSVIFANGLSVGNPNFTQDGVYEQTKVATAITTTAIANTATQITAFRDSAYYVEADIIARQTGSASECNTYKLALKVKNNAGTLTAGTVTTIYSEEETAAWSATLDTSGTAIRVRVTGEAGKAIRWGVVLRVRRI